MLYRAWCAFLFFCKGMDAEYLHPVPIGDKSSAFKKSQNQGGTKMKKRLTGKMSCIAILSALLVISVAEVIVRCVTMQELLLNVSNIGEPFLMIIISSLLLFFAVKGKDRVFYILSGAFLA